MSTKSKVKNIIVVPDSFIPDEESSGINKLKELLSYATGRRDVAFLAVTQSVFTQLIQTAEFLTVDFSEVWYLDQDMKAGLLVSNTTIPEVEYENKCKQKVREISRMFVDLLLNTDAVDATDIVKHVLYSEKEKVTVEQPVTVSTKKGATQNVAMMSLEDFTEVAGVIQKAIKEKTFADFDYLTKNISDPTKLKSRDYKFAYRTVYKGLLNEAYPARKVENPSDGCFTKHQTRYDVMMKDGVEAAFKKIADEVAMNPDQPIKEFSVSAK